MPSERTCRIRLRCCDERDLRVPSGRSNASILANRGMLGRCLGHSHSIISWLRNLLSTLIFMGARSQMSVGMYDKLFGTLNSNGE
jgi:hypothetical protein